MRLLASMAILATLTCGCIARLDPGDTQKARYLIIGLGIVWVNDSKPEAATVSGVKSLGVTVSDRPGMKLAVGYTDSYAVTVPDGKADVVIDFSQNLSGDAKVEVTHAAGQKEEKDKCQ
ncbi:MAG: hypothetical protein ACYDIC_06815 [Desulfobaccales bacterium]